MTDGITLEMLATQLKPLSGINYRIEKSRPEERAAYEKLQAYDRDRNNSIDLLEFRDYYLGTIDQKTIPLAVNDARCQAADRVLNASETDDPQVLESAFSYIARYDETLTDIMLSIALDKAQPNIAQFFNAMVLYTQGISESTWEDEILSEMFKMGEDRKEPAGAIYALDFMFVMQGYTAAGDPDRVSKYTQILQAAMQLPAIHNNQTYMHKALRTLCVFDKKSGAGAINTYVIEQLGKPLPPYGHLEALLSDTAIGLEEQVIPFMTQLYRLTNDADLHDILRQILLELYSVDGYFAARAALSEINSVIVPETTLGSMIRSMASIGGNNRNLVIEKNVPAEYYMYTLMAATDTNRDGIISVPEYRAYYLKKTIPKETLPLFSESACLYVQDLFSNKPGTAVITNGSTNEASGEKLVGKYLDYATYTLQAMKDMLADMARDPARPGLSRLAAIQYLFNYLSLEEAEYNSWLSVLVAILKSLAMQTEDPLTCLEIGYYMFHQNNEGYLITKDYIQYLKMIEQFRKVPQIKTSPDLMKKLELLIKSVQGVL